MRYTSAHGEVVVGVHPLRHCPAVLGWAADAAARRDLALRLVLCFRPRGEPFPGPPGARDEGRQGPLTSRDEGERALAEAVEWLRRRHPGGEVRVELVDGVTSVVLGERSRRAELVVVGSRGSHGPTGLLTGGPADTPVSARAVCPVAVVREPPPVLAKPPQLVVGVDGGDTSRAAVGYAVEEAALRGASVRAVWVWPRPGAGTTGLLDRRRMLAESVASRAGTRPRVPVVQEIRRGHPVEELARTATHAVALVVGHGDAATTRLGTVPQGLLHRARCPTITVPSP